MGTRNSDYTRTERVLTAVKRLLGEPGWVSVAELARLTNAPRPACRDDLELVRKFLTLEEVGGEPELRWVMPGRKVNSRDRAAYELAAQGLTWEEIGAAWAAVGQGREVVGEASRPARGLCRAVEVLAEGVDIGALSPLECVSMVALTRRANA